MVEQTQVDGAVGQESAGARDADWMGPNAPSSEVPSLARRIVEMVSESCWTEPSDSSTHEFLDRITAKVQEWLTPEPLSDFYLDQVEATALRAEGALLEIQADVDEDVHSDLESCVGQVLLFVKEERERKELASHTAQESRGEWQPIETGPTDGTFVLVLTRGTVKIGYYGPKYSRYGVNYGDQWGYGNGCGDTFIELPTHWMPLPPVPQTVNVEEESRGS